MLLDFRILEKTILKEPEQLIREQSRDVESWSEVGCFGFVRFCPPIFTCPSSFFVPPVSKQILKAFDILKDGYVSSQEEA